MVAGYEPNYFIQRVRAYAQVTLERDGTSILEVAELAPGVVCVRDNCDKGEANVYFDMRIWVLNEGGNIKHPTASLPATKETAGIGVLLGANVLYGSGHGGTIREFSEAVVFAKRNLIPIVEMVDWHDAPVSIESRL